MHYLNEYQNMRLVYIKFDGLVYELTKATSRLNLSAKELAIPWEGSAEEAYLIRLTADLLRIAICVEHVKRAKELLYEIIDGYQKTEGLVEQVIGGMGK